jgi:hypothetical protein
VGLSHLLKLKYTYSSVPSAYFGFNKYPIKTHNGANAKFSINWDETDYNLSHGPVKAAQLQALAAQLYDILLNFT